MKVKLLNKNATVPTYATDGSGAMDLYCCEDDYIPRFTRSIVKTGIAMAIPKGYVGIIKSRSSLAKRGIDVKAGVIDSDYRGDIGVMLRTGDTKFVMKRGDRIAQLLIIPVITEDIEVVDDLDETERGEGGYGSTGV